jgi:hypothetical protein
LTRTLKVLRDPMSSGLDSPTGGCGHLRIDELPAGVTGSLLPLGKTNSLNAKAKTQA